MKDHYDHQEIEKKWRTNWAESKLDLTDVADYKNKCYCLDMFPYPSGDGLHVGHWRGYVLSDYFARYNRLLGKNVLHPIGFDAFGLPAENAAIKNKSHPQVFTYQAVERFTEQLKQMGASYDWTKTVNTSKPEYYRWTQWLFLQLYRHNYAEKRLSWVNWCPRDQTVLANEQVVNGKCERCGSIVTKKQLSQWFFLITKMAQELLDGLELLDWPENVKALQRNWIGKSEGAIVKFHTSEGAIEVFTTRADTLFGVTAIVLAPEHPLVSKLTQPAHKNAVQSYLKTVESKTDVERLKEKENGKTGVFTGSTATHPLTKEELPVWVADYVLMGYGTGAIMAVPAHDARDYIFARAHNLPIKQVIDVDTELPSDTEGKLTNSTSYNSLFSEDARIKIADDLERKGLGRPEVHYRLRDWLVSRQRYWGAPIPIVYKADGEIQAVSEEYLPLELPTDVGFKPGGKSPIARSKDYQLRAEKLYGKNSRFDTDTLDTFVDSSWYFLRYLSPTDSNQAFDPNLVARWLPVDLYIGGIEHAILHLLYSRFIYRFLARHRYIKTDNPEPFQKLFNIGMVGLHGAKMSKSKGNVVSPDELVEHYGTDALRGYELFLGPMEHSLEWNPRGINGIHRFLIKVWKLQNQVSDNTDKKQQVYFDQYLHDINLMLKDFRLNTAISAAMIFVNNIEGLKNIDKEVWKRFLVTLAPAFPFISEELWSNSGQKDSIFKAHWPEGFGSIEDQKQLKVLLDQRFIGEITAHNELSEDSILEEIKNIPELAQKIGDKSIKRSIYKHGELINLITK